MSNAIPLYTGPEPNLEFDKFRPLGNRVLLKRFEGPTHYGRIVIPEAHREKTWEAEVVSVGPDVKDPEIKKGVIVIFGKFSGIDTRANVNGKPHLVVREWDILAIIEDDAFDKLHDDVDRELA
jgi:co-chaperonin GroES (HSP10)